MKNLLLSIVIIIFLLSNSALAQKSEISDQLKNSVKKGEIAKKHAISAMDHIKQSRQMNFAQNQFYFSTNKAFSENNDANEETEKARAIVSDVKNNAEKIKCFGTPDEAESAANNFIAAKIRFREANNYLRTVKTTEEKNEALNSISSAKGSIEEAIKYLNFALKDLNDALVKLDECK